ncbi:MAG: hypothetical protein CL897_04810 [Dehalococcoidia bacterium]|nr:hypothetical protein [Dehalococcoidia bacterium]|tara:strand:+ start:1351 stop:2760 length:1410 start_codon:yes stop_codon:yes gene_type:complete
MVTAQQPDGDDLFPKVMERQRFTVDLSHLRRMVRWPSVGALLFAAIFCLLLGVGTLLLLVPASSTSGTTVADAFFATVSAVTLTGLTTVEVQEHWTLLGEGVLAALTLLGGFLYLVGATVLLWLLGRRLGMRDSAMKRLYRGVPALGEVLGVVRTVFKVAFTVQAIGAIALLLAMLVADVPTARAIWWGPFHAVSAFNNTGFALSDGGYAAFSDDIPVLAVTGILAMLGAIGPLPLALFVSRGSFRRLTLDGRIVLLVMFAVLIVGAVVLLLGEWTNSATIGAEPAWRRPFLALFESSARTTGFTTLDMASVRDESKVFATGLMLIGGAAGSVSGGIKVGTIAILATGLINALAGRDRLSLLGRQLPSFAFRHGLAMVTLLGAFAISLCAAMFGFSDANPLDVLFVSVSAISLSGWSVAGILDVGSVERGLLIAAMLFGRLGPLLLVIQMARNRGPSSTRYVEDSIRFG